MTIISNCALSKLKERYYRNETLAQELKQPSVRGSLDNKISNANALLSDNTVNASEKVGCSIQPFKRSLSSTPYY